jgi:hypothetical protein
VKNVNFDGQASPQLGKYVGIILDIKSRDAATRYNFMSDFTDRINEVHRVIAKHDMAPTKMLLPVILELVALTQAAQVNFTLDLTWEKGAPNGVERDMIFVNDAFPGPSLIMDQGDEVTVSSNRL